MKTIELKHLAAYLPYGLKCQYIGIVDVLKYNNATFDDPFDLEDNGYGLKIGELKEIKIYRKYWTALIGKYHGHLKSCINGYEMQPILRPLSKETLNELFKDYEQFEYLHFSEHAIKIQFKSMGEYLEYWIKTSGNLQSCEKWIIDLFNENHVDYNGLIKSGLAIDINTLNQ